MKAFKVIFKHGHFIDLETGIRLIPLQDAEYTISAPDKAFKTEDVKLKIVDPLESKEKAAWAESEFGKNDYAKIVNAGQMLFFRVGNSRKIEGDESQQYIFVCRLLENLYLYLQKGKKGVNEGDWRLAKCHCVLEKCLLGGLTLTEKIPALSLNKLFSPTVMFYFNMQRSSAANAFHTFFLYKPDMNIRFEEAMHERYEGLGDIRKNLVQELRKLKKPDNN